ncbi:hypothetical protein [Psychrobacter sp. I-STPA10]|uniref:hypothetical protein n=1 Tax=Psychrobacter sp. I-STPA10 TaxID=2585769 RepID=UPI001E52D8E1|nr:hypothetical protein [Psychrobacter sp. I-STPA10]
MKNNLPTLQAYRRQYETSKSLGAAMLACNAVLVPEGFENLYVLIQNFQRPMVTNNDAADVDYARGLAAHVAGVPKTSFESQWTMIETESGVIADFAEKIVNVYGGILPSARIYDGFVGDGNEIKGQREYEIIDCAVTFADGGGEIDSASRSQILQVQAGCRYMYFGQSGKLGSSGSEDVFANVLTNALNNFGHLTPQSSGNNVTIYG